MKKLMYTLLALSFVTPMSALASTYDDEGFKYVHKDNGKFNEYMAGKPCSDIEEVLNSNGWASYRDTEYPPVETDKEHHNYELFNKYKSLESCSGSNYGECYARFKKNNFFLTVKYLGAEGGVYFDTEDCGASSYKVEVGGFK